MTDFLDDFFSVDKVKARHELSKRTIAANYYDGRTYERTLDMMAPLVRCRDDLCQTVDTGVGMTEDLFHLLHKVEPQDTPDEEIALDYLINAWVRNELRGLKELDELRQLGTIGDPVNAGLGVASLEPDVAAVFDRFKTEREELKRLQDLIDQLLETEQQIEDTQSQIDAVEDPDSALQGQLAGQQARAQSVQEAIEAAQEALRKGIRSKAQQGRQDLAQGVSGAMEQAKDLQSFAQTWGTDSGALTRLNGEERIALAKRIRNRPKLQKLAKLIGRFARVAHAEQRRKVTFARSEVVGLEQGGDLNRVVSTELARLRHPKLRKGFYRDLVEEKLVEYRMEGDERAGLGSIICVFDGSGSMAGDKECFAKAVTFALMDLAKTQHRPFRGIQFGWADELREWSFHHPEDFTPDQILDMAEFFFNGGTEFAAPLSLALSHLEEDARAGKMKGDIVFITDGQCQVAPRWLAGFKARQERLGFQVFGVVIGGSQNSEPLNSICDGRVVTIQNLLTPEDMRGVFGAINSP